jgi:hypothetical protein
VNKKATHFRIEREEVSADKVIEITGYPMYAVATLDSGDKIALTGNTVERYYPTVGDYYVTLVGRQSGKFMTSVELEATYSAL